MAGYNGYNGMPNNGMNAGWGNGMNNGYNGYSVAPSNSYGNSGGWNNPQPSQQPAIEYQEFVHGRAGAEAYQLKPGVNRQVLWDDETDRFYIKGYDNNGRPRVLADNDFIPHVEPEPQVPQIDLSNYATKDDLKQMLSEAFKNIQLPKPNMTGYVTQHDLDVALSGLSVGNGGRIVRFDESNA